MITTVEEMIEHYVQAWNKKSLEEYRAAFTECWANEGTYTDPNYALQGLNALIELAHTSLPQSPERFFSVLTQPDYHHNVGRYTWKVETPAGTKEGFDYFEFNEELKITKLATFF